jgi:hypothetical protein
MKKKPKLHTKRVWVTHDRTGYELHFKIPEWDKECELFTKEESIDISYGMVVDWMQPDSKFLNGKHKENVYNTIFCQEVLLIVHPVKTKEMKLKKFEKISHELNHEEARMKVSTNLFTGEYK